ncbi:hypothetical protein AB1Y20_020345 [Prymnesium parvum]|uniref:HAT C-terminal dimerisation domain-containing protein n=1 Tax=Prymnesium parvum TaxID=97485 RepID=A0AB34JZ11_PRYPA
MGNHGACTAKIIGSRLVDSTIYIGEKRMAYNVKYDIDSNTQEFEEEEIRPLLVVESMPERKEIIAAVMPAFDYLESRTTGMCETSEYSCAHMYHVAKVSRAFDPSYAYQQMSESHVEELVSTILPLTNHICSKKLMNEMPKYMAMAKDFEVSHEDVNAFSQKILRFWRSTSDTDMSEWRKAARITFSVSPNSAACERVFSLLQNMYGEAREHVLIGDATTKKMLEIVRTKEAQLQLELAAMLDVRQLVKTTYELEGDRLEILIVHRRIDEELRAFGRRLAANEDGVLMNVDSLLRSQAKLQVGTVISKVFAGHGTFKGQIESTEICDSTMYPGRERIAYTVRYPSDNTKEDLEDEEIRPLINVTDLPERKAVADILGKAFEYLESRLTGTCEDQYDASSVYEIFRLVQVFDPQYATNHLTTAWVDNFAIITPLANLADLNEMKKEMHSYMTAATSFSVSSVDIDIYSDCILSWWRTNGASFPSWATAARIVFAFTPNSASVERVFAKLRNMFDVDQMRTLGSRQQRASRVTKTRVKKRMSYDQAFKLQVVHAALQRPTDNRIKPTCALFPGIEPCQVFC